jgi:uncharacterized repeat protein (TIGR02543 family)
MEVFEMKKKKRSQTKARVALAAMICLIMGSIGSTSVFAAAGEVPEKGWDRLIGGSGSDQFNEVAAASGGGFLAAGSTVDNPDNPQQLAARDTDGMLVKSDAKGTILWKKFLGGAGDDILNDVVELADGSILVVGSTTSSASGDIQSTNKGSTDTLLAKYSAGGALVWVKTTGGDKIDCLNDAIPTADGGFLAVGYSQSSANGTIYDKNNGTDTYDGYIVKFNAAGNIQWDNLFGSPEFDYFYSVVQTGDGGFVVAGNANGGGNGVNTGGEITDVPSVDQLMPNDALLVKFDENGFPVWDNLFGSSSADAFYGLSSTPDGGFLAVGNAGAVDGDVTTGESNGLGTALAVKFNSAGVAQWNRAFSAEGYANLHDVVMDKDGNYVAVGVTMGQSGGTGYDGLVANISSNGALNDTRVVGGKGGELLYGITMDQTGHLLAGGTSSSSQTGMIHSVSNGGFDGLLCYFGQSEYQVAFEENGGAEVADQVVAFGNPVAGSVSTQKTGHTFTGWFADAELTKPFSLTTQILQDTTLYAGWSVNRYDVIFNENGGTLVEDQTALYETLAVEPPAPERYGYTFAGWYTNRDCTGPWSFATDKVISTTTLYAKWAINQYTVTFDSMGGTGVDPIKSNYLTSIQPPASPTRTGYTFAGWYTGTCYQEPWDFPSNKLTGDVILYAKWTPNTYYIKFKGNGATSGTMTAQTMAYGTSKALTSEAYKKTGYSFLGWATSSTGPVVYKNGVKVKNLTAVNGASVTLYAKWGAPIKSAASAGYNKIKVTWAYAGSATSYKIYRATKATGTYKLVYTAKSTARSWTNTGLATGKTYYYKVYPVAKTKTYAHKLYKLAKPIPGTPVVTVTKASSKSIRINWTGVSGATRYQVYRATSATGIYKLVYTASPKLRSWTNSGLTAGKTYYYKVVAYHLEKTSRVYGKYSIVKSCKL